MIVWKGWGFLIAVVGFLGILGAEIISETIMKDEQFYQNNTWVMAAGFFGAAILTWILARTFLAPTVTTVLDETTQQEINLTHSHSLFFIPAKWWPLIFVAFSIAVLFQEYKYLIMPN